MPKNEHSESLRHIEQLGGGDPPTMSTFMLQQLREKVAERMKFERETIEHLESVGIPLPENADDPEEMRRYEDATMDYMHTFALKADWWRQNLSPEMKAKLFADVTSGRDVRDSHVMDMSIHEGVKTEIGRDVAVQRADALAKKNVEVLRQNLALQQHAVALEKEKIRLGLDALTGLHTRGSYENELARRNKNARMGEADHRKEKRENRYWLIYVDIDHFKAVNDTYGHPVGDEVIKAVAQTIKDSVRSEDFVARIGGEEIATIVSDGDMDVIGVAERMRAAVEKKSIIAGKNAKINVTISLGVSEYMEDTTHHGMAADAALQAAKGNKKAAKQLADELGVTIAEDMPDPQNSRNRVWSVVGGQMREYKPNRN